MGPDHRQDLHPADRLQRPPLLGLRVDGDRRVGGRDRLRQLQRRAGRQLEHRGHLLGQLVRHQRLRLVGRSRPERQLARRCSRRPSSTTFTEGVNGTFTPTASGSPTPVITESGTLPTGVTFTGGALTGTPTETGSFPITLTATNGIESPATQDFTLNVVAAPTVTGVSPTLGPGDRRYARHRHRDQPVRRHRRSTSAPTPAPSTADSATSITVTSPAGSRDRPRDRHDPRRHLGHLARRRVHLRGRTHRHRPSARPPARPPAVPPSPSPGPTCPAPPPSTSAPLPAAIVTDTVHLDHRHLARRHGRDRRRDGDHPRRHLGDLARRPVHLRWPLPTVTAITPTSGPTGRRYHRHRHRDQPVLGATSVDFGTVRRHRHRRHGHLDHRHLAGRHRGPST